MGLLDKLKPQPRWKHADPAVRLEAVRDLHDPADLAWLAETDPDARVRRSAICRTDDTAVLGRIAAGDGDAEARDRAADRLLALASSNGSDGDRALAAVRALTDQRRLAVLAKGDAIDAVRADALGRMTDQRSLSSIARHARHESSAQVALDRITEATDLIEVAQNGEHRDVALRAFERLVESGMDLELLRSIEARAQQKPVARRARAVIQGIEAAESARRAAEEDRRKRETAVCEAAERLGEITDAAAARAELTRLSDEWRQLDVADEGLRGRFDRAAAAAAETIARREREAEEAAERARVRAEALATRHALCQRVETLEGDDVLAQLIPIEEEWRSLMPLVGDGPEADRLAERFAQAIAACRTRHEMSAALAEMRVALDALLVEAEGLPAQNDEPAALARWQTLSREARNLVRTLAEGARPADDVTARLDAVEQRFRDRETARREAALKAQQDVLRELQRLAERTRRAIDAETVTLREGDRLMRDIGAGLEAIGSVEATREIEQAAAKLRSLQEQIAPRVRELREMDEWRRFANAQRQEQLIAMAEAIVSSLKVEEEAGKQSDLAATARALRELHAKWHEAAEAPRHSAQRLWDRFRGATDFIRSRCEPFFAEMREARETSLQKKRAIVEEAEAIATSSNWNKTAARFRELQTAWQETGVVPRETGRELAQRFRTACNAFFARRREDLAARKKTWSDNLERKEALVARAETLAESTDWEAASAEMKRLQAEWKSIGPVRRNKSEVVWNRFRAAADRFFERYHNRHQIALANKLAEREAIVVELEQLADADPAAIPSDLVDRVQQLRSTWNRSVPIPTAEMRALADRWQAALSRVVERHADAFKGSDLDPQTVRQKMERLLAKVEAYLGDVRESSAGQSQTEILAARLRSALASNAIGGRVGEDARWRAAADTVKEAQGAWLRLVPLAGPESRALDARFRDACRRVLDHARRHTSTGRRPPRATAVGA